MVAQTSPAVSRADRFRQRRVSLRLARGGRERPVKLLRLQAQGALELTRLKGLTGAELAQELALQGTDLGEQVDHGRALTVGRRAVAAQESAAAGAEHGAVHRLRLADGTDVRGGRGGRGAR